ncbi:MAG: Transcription termination/antitermination protein NusA [Verrucomicrobia subdivision 3 bacterium]|nr:Transcription termination/antitermination protein NusA [Limisphaerales bacterium]MCS1412962.1 Transcription termination/antitermination protein NusA [Limisphaerales bacterium]
MNADLLATLDFWEREKGISKDTLFEVVEEALVSAAKKAINPARDLRVSIDPKTGDIRTFSKRLVVEEVTSQHDEISLPDARKTKKDAELGDEVEIEVTPTNFGRIASQAAKQAIMQQLRRVEKQLIYSEFKDRTGDIVSGVVRRFDRSDVFLDLGRFEAILPNHERVPTEEYQIGERIRCFVKAVEYGPHGPDIILSRSDPNFVIKLFQVEVSEINDGTIEIKSIAREAGYRTKLAVHSHDSKVDPVGACVGLRGQRVKNIVRELNNEKVDIIPWSDDQRTFVANALSPAKLLAFEPEEGGHRIKVLVEPDQLSLAIGKRGQNARLTSKLCDCHIDIQAQEVTEMGFEEKVAQAVRAFATIAGITEKQANTLVNIGFHTLEDLLQVDLADLQEIPEIGDSAAQILESAKAESTRRLLKLEETQ